MYLKYINNEYTFYNYFNNYTNFVIIIWICKVDMDNTDIVNFGHNILM